MARWKNINGVLQKIAGSVRIDQVLNKLSRNAISNKAVSEKFEEVDLSLEIAAYDIDALSDRVSANHDLLDISKWTDVTEQCVRTQGVTFVYLRVLDNGYKYRISFTLLNAAGVQHSIFKLPKAVSERMVFPLVGDNGNGTTTGAIGNLICIGTNDVLISSAGATSYFSDIVEVYHV